jgi:hypothetical protein
MSVTNVSSPTIVGWPYRNGLVTDYAPLQVPMSTVVVPKQSPDGKRLDCPRSEAPGRGGSG